MRVCALLGTVLLFGCHDFARSAVLTPNVVAVGNTAVLVIERTAEDDSTLAIVVRLTPPATAARIGSVTASIDFDTTALRFLRDDSSSDHAIRAVHVDRGRLRLAAASADGLDPNIIARLRFGVRSNSLVRAALPALALQIIEMHSIDAQDAKSNVTVLPVVVTP